MPKKGKSYISVSKKKTPNKPSEKEKQFKRRLRLRNKIGRVV